MFLYSVAQKVDTNKYFRRLVEVPDEGRPGGKKMKMIIESEKDQRKRF